MPGLDLASEAIPLQDVFIEPQMEAERASKETPNAEPSQAGQSTKQASEQLHKTSRPEPANDVLERQDLVVILGEPGQRKSTLLRQYVSALAPESILPDGNP